jgi:DNA-directed RNA polymerase specialized sigma24 family protein
MSPSTVRRYRAERLLRREFVGRREEVLRGVRGRLRARGVHLDEGDLEACYAVAWQGLYAAVAAGEEVVNPGGWLAVVTFRRAIDEHRSAGARGLDRPVRLDADTERAIAGSGTGGAPTARVERDLAAELDDRARLRQLFEALRSRLDERECEAASLCYLQGFTRAQAAQSMGISETRMTKLMEGRGAGRPGVAAKVGELLEMVGGGRWCEQQGSLMRGFALGILDPDGERYRLARLHQRECPACRAYVLSLRGLAAVLPPLPPPWTMVPHTAPAGHSPGAEAGRGVRGGHSPGANTGAGAKAGAGAGGGAAAASAGAAGAGGAGGGWLLGGSVGTKLVVGCLLALGVGCVAITTVPHRALHGNRGPRRAATSPSVYVAAASSVPSALPGDALPAADALDRAAPTGSAARTHAAKRISATARTATVRQADDRHAQREFGIEQSTFAAAGATQPEQPVAHVATVRPSESGPASATTADTSRSAPPAAPPSHAEREFGPE